MAQIAISYGAAMPPINEQLKEQGHQIEKPEHYEMLRESVLRLHLAGPLTDAMAEKAMQRLHGLVMRNAKEIKTDEKAV